MSSEDIKGAATDASKEASQSVAAASSHAADRAQEVGSQAAGKAQDAAGKAQNLASQAQDVAASLGSKVQDAASSAREMAGDVIGRARDQVQGLSDGLPGSASEAYSAVAQGGDSLGRQVASRPLEALLLAGAIGYLVGWATSRS